MKKFGLVTLGFIGFFSLLAAPVARARTRVPAAACAGLPKYEQLRASLLEARRADNGGFNLDMWGSVVDRAGNLCAIAFTGDNVDSQWPGSRLISAQKAYTANAFSLGGLALSTANLYSATQPGGSLFGLQHSNPLNATIAYRGDAKDFGSRKDPLVGERIGGVNVFGGGLALYNAKGELVGALGVSGDSSCADHNIAWRTRHSLGFDHVKTGVSAAKNDQIIYDVKEGKSEGGFGHVTCAGKEKEISEKLPATAPAQP